MTQNADMTSVNGTIEDVASFFRVSIRTVQDWKKGRTPEIGFFQLGRNIAFGEEDVIALWVKRYSAARRLEPGEAAEIARREWRQHLAVRAAYTETIEELKQEIAEIKLYLETQRGEQAA